MKNDLYFLIRTKQYLRSSWLEVRSSAIHSTSDEIKSAAEQFSIDPEKNLKTIQRKLQHYEYEFSKAKGILIKSRPIVIPIISDRIVQRSILEVIQDQPGVQQLLKYQYSFGGVKGGGVEKAIRKVCSLKDTWAKHYLRSDISKYFTTVLRIAAIKKLTDHLPNHSLDDILIQATTFEYANLCPSDETFSQFPTYELGIAQGCCLSPLLGNAYLAAFDEEMNSEGGTACIRYIDDFIILGTGREKTTKAFKKAKALLAGMKLAAYDPAKGEGKAAEGPTHKPFEFLGCIISGRSIYPSKKSRIRLLEKARICLRNGEAGIIASSDSNRVPEKYSLIATLYRLNNILKAWSGQYSFCNCAPEFRDMDGEIDVFLRKYFGIYGSKLRKVGNGKRRELLGLCMLSNCRKRNPIYG